MGSNNNLLNMKFKFTSIWLLTVTLLAFSPWLHENECFLLEVVASISNGYTWKIGDFKVGCLTNVNLMYVWMNNFVYLLFWSWKNCLVPIPTKDQWCWCISIDELFVYKQ